MIKYLYRIFILFYIENSLTSKTETSLISFLNITLLSAKAVIIKSEAECFTASL